MKWIKKMAIKMAWPLLKKALINQIKNEDYQKIVVDKAEKKIPDGSFTKKAQKEFLNTVYDASQEAAIETIENIDLNKIMGSF